MRADLFNELVPLLKLSAPVALTMLGGLFMQLVDTMFVGRLGPEAIGGVAIGSAVFATLMIMSLGIGFGLDYLVSYSFGAKKYELCHLYLVQAIYLATIVGVVCTALMWLAGGQVWRFGINAEIAHQAKAYLHALCWSLWPFLIFSSFRQYLQAMGIVMPAMVILVVANFVNAFFNWVFIYGHLGSPALGVAGSGISTVFARVFMLVAIVACALHYDRKKKLGLRKADRGVSPEHLKKLVRLGLPSGVQTLLEVGAFATSTMLAGRLGAVPLSAHQIVLHLASFTFMIPLGMSFATSVRVGQAVGAGERARAVRIGWTALWVSTAFAVLMGLTMYMFARPLMRIFTPDERIMHIGGSLLLVAALFQVSDALQVVGAGVLRGIGDTKFSMYANLAGHWALGLPVGYVLCFAVGWGAHGLWIGLSVGLTSVAAALVYIWNVKSKELLA